MGDIDELKIEWASLELFASTDLDLGRIDVVFLALGINKRQGELGSDQWDIRTQLQQIWNTADMVLMTVGEHQCLNLVKTVLDVMEIRQNQIDARLLFFREQHTAVNEQNVSVVFDHIHIASDFAQATQRNDTHRSLAVFRRRNQAIDLSGDIVLLLRTRTTLRRRLV